MSSKRSLKGTEKRATKNVQLVLQHRYSTRFAAVLQDQSCPLLPVFPYLKRRFRCFRHPHILTGSLFFPRNGGTVVERKAMQGRF